MPWKARWISVLVMTCAACSSSPDASASSRGMGPGAVPSAAGSAPVTSIPLAGTSGAFDNSTGNLAVAPMMTMPDGSCNQDVDVVFVLDVSGSMTPSLTKLVAEVGKVDQALQTKNLPSPPHYGLVIFVDDLMVMNGGMPYANIEALKTEVMSQSDMTANSTGREVNGDPTNLTWPENLLDGLYAAATQYKWRPAEHTLRTIFAITDASFWDGTNPSSGADSEAPIPGLDHMSMHSYTDTIAALRMQQIWVNTFAAKTGGPPDGMQAPASHGSLRGISVDVGIGFFEPYKGQKPIAEATGGMAWDLDDVYDGKISLGDPIQMAIEVRQCAKYPN
jgi:hypothetical protein